MEEKENIENATTEEKINLDEYLELLSEKLKLVWGDDLDQKLLLSKRGLAWLGIDENITSIEDINPINFLNKMVDLGKLLSEDEIVSSSAESFDLSPSEAKKMRSKLIGQKEVMEALHNKGNIRHKEALSYINKLNEIIARDGS